MDSQGEGRIYGAERDPSDLWFIYCKNFFVFYVCLFMTEFDCRW